MNAAIVVPWVLFFVAGIVAICLSTSCAVYKDEATYWKREYKRLDVRWSALLSRHSRIRSIVDEEIE